MFVAQNVDVDIRRYLNICLFLLLPCVVFTMVYCTLYLLPSPPFSLSLSPPLLPPPPSLFLLPSLSSPLSLSPIKVLQKLFESEHRYCNDLYTLVEFYYKQLKTAIISGYVNIQWEQLDAIFLNWSVAHSPCAS